ncbi:MucR family transcriptional regulator [Bombella sp. TMW 2.2559]|uniref:MucR family transcriptional regulator n=1 Tax=Bombella dulcis TaxID=2967339 RepID=A0ABT3WER4_9PROT|nr:MucR family transcriptional regulator [Bombella dulcis]MCX5615386.1 MucR family transcriptional regulator [Bombella dulcis]
MPDQITKLTAQIVEAYLTNHEVTAEAVPGLIRSVRNALAAEASPVKSEQEKPVPAVHPRKSVFHDYIICLEDGKKLKTLRRHLMSTYGMTPQQYREKWDLPSTYPMVAPSYSVRRSEIAKNNGLGRNVDD